MPRKVLLAYVPVLHQGYLEFFGKHADATTLYLLGSGLISQFGHLRKEVRATHPAIMRDALRGVLSVEIEVTLETDLIEIRESGALIVMPDEDECRAIAEKYLSGCRVEFDRSIFLRWDRTRVLEKQEVCYDRVVPFEGFAAEIMQRALSEAERATNLWRRVGAVVARDGEMLLAAHNTQVPSPHTPYYEGDPRMFFTRGLHYELTTDDHAERRLIAEAARRGITLEGSDLYVTTFPCPPCGKQVAYAGFRRCYFADGYAALDSERILRDNGVEIIKVEMKAPDS